MKKLIARLIELSLIILAACLLSVALAGCSRSSAEVKKPVLSAQAEPASSEPSTPAAPARGSYFKTSFQNESEFIVQSIATDITEMALYAKNQTAPATNVLLVTAVEDVGPPTDAPKYTIVVKLPKKDLTYNLQVNPAVATIWSPETYDGLTRKIFESLGLKGIAPPLETTPDVTLLDPLLSLTGRTIELENEKLSSLLTNHFTDMVPHERAALLLGAFALREHSGPFFEIRSPLCRMTAHLAMAKAFGNEAPYGLNGRVAEALLYTLMNNEKQALAKIAAFNQETPAVAAWARALTARNTLDFRPLAAVKKRTILETIEYFRAYSLAANRDLAWASLTEAQKIGMLDPCRILNEGSFSIELGHVLSAISIPLEVYEATNVYQTSHHRLPTGNREFVALLNTMPDRCVGLDAKGAPAIHVIGWGQWATFFQRHLCDAMASNYRFMESMWGDKETARTYSEKCEAAFSGLRLYPFVSKLTCRDEKSYHTAVDDSLAVVRATPQIVGAGVWNDLYYVVAFAPSYRPDSPGRVDEWHNHNPPPGTAYNPFPRFDHSNLVRCPDAISRIQRMYDLSPYDADIEYGLVHNKYNGHATYEQAEEIYRPTLEYDSRMMRTLAKRGANDLAKYTPMMTKAAALNPYLYYELGEHLISLGQKDEAIPYLEKGMKLCPDAVAKSAYAETMVKYYLKHGRTNDAAELADFAAEVYSASGLKAKGEFLEASGKYDEAMKYYKMIEERYDDSEAVVNFCVRYKAKTGQTNYDETLARRSRSIFPNGIEHVTISNFNGPPRDGTTVGGENDHTARAGLRYGDVIVALNGIRVHSFEQYNYARATIDSPMLYLIVWQNNRYREITANPPNRRFGVSFPTYAAN